MRDARRELADGLELLRLLQLLLHAAVAHLEAVALHRVAQRPAERLQVDVPLHEVVLGAVRHGLAGGLLVRGGAQDHDRDEGHGPRGGMEGLHALAVGQPQVEQHQVGRALLHRRDPVLEGRRDLDLAGSIPAQAPSG